MTREQDSISDPTLSLVQAIRHLRYVMERFGVTKAMLGVTPHGLRHQYAGDEYRALTGEAPPVSGGGAVARDLDTAARLAIAGRLGHGRVEISNVYLGSRKAASASAAQSPSN